MAPQLPGEIIIHILKLALLESISDLSKFAILAQCVIPMFVCRTLCDPIDDDSWSESLRESSYERSSNIEQFEERTQHNTARLRSEAFKSMEQRLKQPANIAAVCVTSCRQSQKLAFRLYEDARQQERRCEDWMVAHALEVDFKYHSCKRCRIVAEEHDSAEIVAWVLDIVNKDIARLSKKSLRSVVTLAWRRLKERLQH